MINVGIIGCGRIADLHALGYRGNPDARILAVCDENAERAEQRRIEWGADRSYSDYRQLLHNPDI
ncbi:MAG TPA: Gfo/Idh/MocA family oxidoreductase, partial [Candidatus Hydrogenedentes bacterium]|nr:Gfo/Idh/MocA family oxidoreductase [Candidatus Hydrogenedentota bacterium]